MSDRPLDTDRAARSLAYKYFSDPDGQKEREAPNL